MSTPDRRTLIADAAIATVASLGLRGLTHRAVDAAAGLSAGSTSYYFRTREALIGACYRRLAELDLAELDSGGSELGGVSDVDAVAEGLAALLHHWLTGARERQLVRFELSLEAARRPELRAELEQAGSAARARAVVLLRALGAAHPESAADLMVSWTDGLLYDRLAGATARTRPAPDRAELAGVVRKMLRAVLDEA
ncbi:TetR/AcrR family transcriptional regulator [Kitasatospora albolonga]|uniref:TetR/AcrR family transcriptional regulator n=1 Tax=Kitasatospora albolonga TaxID=68173 RepID=UPI0035EF12AD